MARYIESDALLAEIDRQKIGYNVDGKHSVEYDTTRKILNIINTLEVKEVNLEKTIDDYFKDWKFDDELDIMVKPNNYSASFTNLREIAKHFYQLGLKAQKGE